jgi:hypothetical protein
MLSYADFFLGTKVLCYFCVAGTDVSVVLLSCCHVPVLSLLIMSYY